MMFILEKSVPGISCLVLVRINSVQLGLQLGSAHLRTTLFRQFCFCAYSVQEYASFGTAGCENNLIYIYIYILLLHRNSGGTRNSFNQIAFVLRQK